METPAKEVDEWPERSGEYKIVGDSDIVFCCPCGCGTVVSLPIGTNSLDKRKPWGWNGNKEKPTLTPSILFLSGCKWHGFLTDGVFRSC